MTAIQAQDLVKEYRGKVRALDGVSFEVETGQVFALLGPNGAGKTTTVKILTTLSRPTSGTARIDGIDVAANPGAVRRSIGVVAQRAGVDPVGTGRETCTCRAASSGWAGRRLPVGSTSCSSSST
jgi:ABC-2 type transport system ATP-binding protein